MTMTMTKEIMTIKKETMTLYLLVGIAVALFGMLLAPGMIEDVDATSCSTSTHCYASYQNKSFNTNYGIKASITADNVYAPCGSTHHLTAVPIWMTFDANPVEWMEIGYGTGWIATDTSCQAGDILYYHTHIDNVITKANLGTITNGNTYDLKIDRTSTSEQWKIYLDGSLKRTESGTGFNTGKGKAGGEITDTNAIIEAADFDGVQRKTSTSSSSWTNWISTSAEPGYEDAPPYRDHCSSYWHFAVGTDSGVACT